MWKDFKLAILAVLFVSVMAGSLVALVLLVSPPKEVCETMWGKHSNSP